MLGVFQTYTDEANHLQNFGAPVQLPNGYEQLYSPESDPTAIVDTLQHKLCEYLPKEDHEHCIWKADLLQSASSFDIDYSESSKDLKLLGLWDCNKSSPKKLWDLTLKGLGSKARVEVGVMDQRPAIETHDIQLGGVVSVLEQSKELSQWPLLLQAFTANTFKNLFSSHLLLAITRQKEHMRLPSSSQLGYIRSSRYNLTAQLWQSHLQMIVRSMLTSHSRNPSSSTNISFPIRSSSPRLD